MSPAETADGPADWIARAAAIAPRTELFVDGRFVPAASERPSTTSPAATAPGSRPSPRAAPRSGSSRRGRPLARSTTGAGRPATDGRKRVLLRSPSWSASAPTSWPCSNRSTSASRSGTRSGSTSPSAARTIQWYAETIDKAYGEVGPTGPDALSLVTREPIGVVAAIVPWNYPLIVTAWKLGPALATGNSVVLKPAEQSPLTALRLGELAAEPGSRTGVLNVVTGPGAVIGDALARHPDVDKIAFTGSTEVGKSLLRDIGESNGKAVSLELGGKSPQIVLADAPDLEAAAQAIGWGIFYNAGQTCHAGSRLVVHRSVREDLVERIAALGRKLAPGEPLDPRIRVGSIVDDPSWPRSSATSNSVARKAPGSSPAASRSARRPAATTSSRPSSTAWTTPGGWPARRSSGRSSPSPSSRTRTTR